jgi:hypothetical protein
VTFAVGHVEGGTHAGWRKVKQKRGPWTCGCLGPERPSGNAHSPTARDAVMHPGYLCRCPDCKTERP